MATPNPLASKSAGQRKSVTDVVRQVLDGIDVARGKASAQPLSNTAMAAQAAKDSESPLGQRPFGPGTPKDPPTAPDSPERMLGPRQYQAPITANLQTTPRSEYGNLTPMAQLRTLSEMYDVLAICIATRIEEATGMAWSIAPKNKQSSSNDARIKLITKFFEQPDGLNEFASWFAMLLYDLFSIDAMTLYKRQTKGGGLYALEVVDGATIKPLLDDRGRTLAYQQILWGYPYSQYSRPSANEKDEQLPIFAPEKLIYRPRWTRSYTPYGFPPSEWIILRVNQALRKQSFDLSYFTDGNIPEAMAWPPGESLNPEQVNQFEEQFNAILAGNDAARRKIRFFPWRMDMKEFRSFSYETKLDEWMLKITCAATGVPPQEIGFTADVNKASATLQQSVNERRGLRPLMQWFKGMFDRIIAEDFGAEDLEFQWHFGESADRLVVAQTDAIYVGMGAISVEAITALRFGDVVNVEEEQKKLAAQAEQKKADAQAALELAQAKASANGNPPDKRIANTEPDTAPADEKKPVTRGNITDNPDITNQDTQAKKLAKVDAPDQSARTDTEDDVAKVMDAYLKQQRKRIQEKLNNGN